MKLGLKEPSDSVTRETQTPRQTDSETDRDRD